MNTQTQTKLRKNNKNDTTVNTLLSDFEEKEIKQDPILELKEGVKIHVRILDFGLFTSRNYPDGIPFFTVMNLIDGELNRMWIDGGLRGALSPASNGDLTTLKGRAFAITRGPQKSITSADGEPQRVNTYVVAELTPKAKQ